MDNDARENEVVEQEPSLKPKSKRGFASLDPQRRTELARLGGKAAHAKGRAHEWNSDTARAAGKKGGAASHEARRTKRFETQ